MLESVTTQILTDDAAHIQQVAIDRGEAVEHTIRYLLRLGFRSTTRPGWASRRRQCGRVSHERHARHNDRRRHESTA